MRFFASAVDLISEMWVLDSKVEADEREFVGVGFQSEILNQEADNN